MHPTVLTTLSARGGVGKSSVAVGLARALATRGKICVLLDLDLSVPSLASLLGCEDRVVYDLGDVLAGRDVDGVLVSLSRGLYLLPGAYRCDRSPTRDDLTHLLSSLVAATDASYLILDTSAVSDPVTRTAVSLSHRTLAVSVPGARMQEAVSSLVPRLNAWGGDPRLVLNRFSLSAPCDVRDVIDTSSLPLLGIIPLCVDFGLRPDVCDDRSSPLAVAFDNLAARICGTTVPLLAGVTAERRALLGT